MCGIMLLPVTTAVSYLFAWLVPRAVHLTLLQRPQSSLSWVSCESNHPFTISYYFTVVIDPPTNPGDGEVTILCSTGTISWTLSTGADYYIINMYCGENHVLKDIGVDGTTYNFNYSLSLRNSCKASVYAVNLAGNSSVYSFATVLARGKSIVQR